MTISTRRFQVASLVLGFTLALTTLVSADDRFALAVGARDMLVVFGPKGERITELPVPSISQPVTIGSTSFQVSYGRDANNLLTAILAPNPSQPQDLHFNVLNKAVDADKQAVITLTFSNGMSHVTVDPGYVGSVAVNSHSIRHREIADESPSPASVPDMTPQMRTTSTVAPRDLPTSTPLTSTEPAADQMAAAASASTPATPPLPAVPSAADVAASPNAQHLYWSEPITSPDGTAPTVGLNQMKLVEVKGTVSVKTADGTVHEGKDGMLVPSGASIQSASNSSAAVFMGGVNSARLLPNTNVEVSQNMQGTVRKTTLNLKDGTVFSRVGRRPGETQDYQVHTPEGVAAARGTEYATVVRHGHTYVFVARGSVAMFEGAREIKMVIGAASIGKGSMPSVSPKQAATLFVEVMTELQPFNGKLSDAIAAVASGTATPQQKAYYANAVSVIAAIDPNGGVAITGVAANGDKVTEVTTPDGTTSIATTTPGGTTTVATTTPDGTTVLAVTTPDGTTTTTTTDGSGNTSTPVVTTGNPVAGGPLVLNNPNPDPLSFSSGTGGGGSAQIQTQESQFMNPFYTPATTMH